MWTVPSSAHPNILKLAKTRKAIKLRLFKKSGLTPKTRWNPQSWSFLETMQRFCNAADKKVVMLTCRLVNCRRRSGSRILSRLQFCWQFLTYDRLGWRLLDEVGHFAVGQTTQWQQSLNLLVTVQLTNLSNRNELNWTELKSLPSPNDLWCVSRDIKLYSLTEISAHFSCVIEGRKFANHLAPVMCSMVVLTIWSALSCSNKGCREKNQWKSECKRKPWVGRFRQIVGARVRVLGRDRLACHWVPSVARQSHSHAAAAPTTSCARYIHHSHILNLDMLRIKDCTTDYTIGPRFSNFFDYYPYSPQA